MQLYEHMRKEIITGEIGSGEKLPSIREISKSTGLSRTTIESAYFQLLTEGYILSRPKSGYYAADLTEIELDFPSEKPRIEDKSRAMVISQEIKYFNENRDSASLDASMRKRLYGKILKDR